MWTPAPKQRLQKIKEINPAFYDLLEKFYNENTIFPEKVGIMRQITSVVFEK